MNVIDSIINQYPLFNEKEFKRLCEVIFEHIQNAWMNGDIKELSIYETSELLVEHRKDLEKLKQNHAKDIVKDIRFESTEIVSFQEDTLNELEIIDVKMKLSMINYYVNEKTHQIIKGSDVHRREGIYRLSFINKKGSLLEKKLASDIKICPYCGGPIHFSVSLSCDYCGRTISIDTEASSLKLMNLVLLEVR